MPDSVCEAARIGDAMAMSKGESRQGLCETDSGACVANSFVEGMGVVAMDPRRDGQPRNASLSRPVLDRRRQSTPHAP